MEVNNNDGKAKVLAYYLPQFYPCDFNDKWYGRGFTEWTNVGKAKPLFKGHYQPKVPADLGYYDLRIPENAEKQVDLAREAGVFGFAYWHYWWAGEMLLNMPAERMLKTLKPDFPFMFAWANENWYKKFWDKDVKKDTLIMKQTYPGEADNLAHFNYCLPFFKDKRYLTYDSKPMFLIYHPLKFPEVKAFMKQWDSLIKEAGVADGFYWICCAKNNDFEYKQMISLGFDAVNFFVTECRLAQTTSTNKFSPKNWLYSWGRHIKKKVLGPIILDYNKIIDSIWVDKYDKNDNVIPTVIPNWDHTPRSGYKGYLFVNSSPENFEKLSINVLSKVKYKENKLVFLKSWNEWAEGNYMEPDLKYGKGYIESLNNAIEKTKEK